MGKSNNHENLTKLCGYYFCESKNLLRQIMVKNGELFYQRSLHNGSFLLHLKDNLFAMKGVDNVLIEFLAEEKTMILRDNNNPELVFSSFTEKVDQTCPVCKGKVAIFYNEQQNCFTVNCFNNCDTFDIVKKDLLDHLTEPEMAWIKTYLYNLSYNFMGVDVLSKSNIEEWLADYQFIKTVMDDYGFMDAVVENAGGGDRSDPMYIVKTGGKKYSLRIYDSKRDLAAIEAELYWLNHLSKNGITLPIVCPDNLGKQIHYIASLNRYSVLREWAEGLTLFAMSQNGLPDNLEEQLGELIAKMHEASVRMSLPQELVIEKRDSKFYEKLLQDALKDDFDSNDQREEFGAIAKNMIDALKDSELTKEYFAVIHGDITFRNIIYHNGQLIPIDFKAIREDHLLTDIVQLFHNGFPSDDYTQFWQGYEKVREIPAEWEEHLPIFSEANFMNFKKI